MGHGLEGWRVMDIFGLVVTGHPCKMMSGCVTHLPVPNLRSVAVTTFRPRVTLSFLLPCVLTLQSSIAKSVLRAFVMDILLSLKHIAPIAFRAV